MGQELPTCKVKAGDSFAIINESDYDEEVHGKKLPDDYQDPKPGKAKTEDVEDAAGTTDDEAPSEAKLLKMRKGELVALAEEAGLEIVPDEETIPTLAKKIVAAQEAKTAE